MCPATRSSWSTDPNINNTPELVTNIKNCGEIGPNISRPSTITDDY